MPAEQYDRIQSALAFDTAANRAAVERVAELDREMAVLRVENAGMRYGIGMVIARVEKASRDGITNAMLECIHAVLTDPATHFKPKEGGQ